MNNFKIVMVGDFNVGKTSLITRLCSNAFNSSKPATVGAAFKAFKLHLDSSNAVVILNIWDTAGQERFYEAGITKNSLRGAHAALICFSIDDPTSFDRVELWRDRILEVSTECVVILVATKMDMLDNLNDTASKFVSRKSIENKAEKMNVDVVLTSAKDGTNVKLAFETAYRSYQATTKSPEPDGGRPPSVALDSTPLAPNNYRCYC